jgi:hypothetical protein
LLTLGGLYVGFGVLKNKADRSLEDNKEHIKQFEGCATQKNLANFKECTDEDRKRNREQHQKLFDSVGDQAKQIGELAMTLRSMELSFKELKDDIQSPLALISSCGLRKNLFYLTKSCIFGSFLGVYSFLASSQNLSIRARFSWFIS